MRRASWRTPRCRSRSCPNPADLHGPSAHTGPRPTLGRVRPPPSSPWDAVQRGSASLRRSARRDDGKAPEHSTWRVATRSTLSPAPRRRADPTTRDEPLTRRPAWTCWVIAQDPVCPAHPPCRLRRAHHQHADRGHARDADLDRNRPPGTRPYPSKTPARGLGPVARVASAYVTAVRTTAASRCRRIAWHEVAGSTPRL